MNKASVVGKIVATGKLKLLSPLLIGNGSQNEHDVYNIDMPVMVDKNGNPFIPATSLAGAFRDIVCNLEYCTACNSEYCSTCNLDDDPKFVTAYIFGTDRDLAKGIKKNCIEEQQSMISIRDVLIENAKISNRDGVSIESITGVAKKAHKYDFEVVERGASGKFYIECTIRKYHLDNGRIEKINKMLKKLWEVLSQGFSLGAMVSKGLGKVCVENLTVDTYDFLNNKSDVLAWLNPNGRQNPLSHKSYEKIEGKVNYPKNSFVIEAEFTINGSILVRDKSFTALLSEAKDNVKAIMKKSRNDFLIPGSSIKGVLRHRAEYIADVLGMNYDMIYLLMGYPSGIKDEKGKEIKLRSRLFVNDVYINPERVCAYNQSRIRLDRFTGGTIEGALFTEQPITQLNSEPPIKITLEIRSAKDHEIGLLICLLRDLWLGRISIGGDKAIGRGILEGVSARILYGKEQNDTSWIMNKNGKIEGVINQPLKKYVDALLSFAKGVNAGENE